MGLAEARASKDEKRIERGVARICSNVHAGLDSEVVAFAVDQGAESV